MYSGKESFQKYSPHSPSILQPRQLTSSSLPASKCPPYPTYGATSVRVWKYPPSDNIPVPLYSFLYSGECSFHDLMSFTNNSYIPNYRKFFHEKPSERYHQARVFMLRETGTNEL